jgi:hypothetical protein
MTTSQPKGIDLTAVEDAVRRRVGGRVIGLAVTLDGGAIVLSGLADCFYTKQLAQVAVLAVHGHRLRANRIRVERSAALRR